MTIIDRFELKKIRRLSAYKYMNNKQTKLILQFISFIGPLNSGGGGGGGKNVPPLPRAE